MEDQRQRNRAFAFAALAAIALALLYLLSRDEPKQAMVAPPPSAGPKVVFGPAPIAPEPQQPEPPASNGPPKPRAPGPPPIVDEIIVEKKEVCSGEENLITVRAHTPDGTDAFLHYTIGADTGAAVPVRATLDDDKKTTARKIAVFGAGNVMTLVDVPTYVVKDCSPGQGAFIVPQLRANTWADFDLEAKVMPLGAKDGGTSSFVPVEWNWTFGDGTAARTTVPLVTHSYEDRPQNTLYSQMLVGVEIVSVNGDKIFGRHSLQLRNPVFEDFHDKGIVSLMVTLDPRFPEANAQGVVVQGVRLRHARPTALTIERAMRFVQYPEQGGETKPVPVDVQSLLGSTQIPAGKDGLAFKVSWDPGLEPDAFNVTYLLDGKTPEGWPVRGGFSVMKPPPKPTKESSQAVMDPVLKAKILAARKILGKEFVTDEDILRLEKEGKLNDLVVEPAPPASSAPPANLPKPPHQKPAIAPPPSAAAAPPPPAK